jgi:23S rRNA (uracil1939-C5)-methyltransferase
VKGKRAHTTDSVALSGLVRDVTDAGDAVVETEERGIVMMRGALPGERVRVRVEETRRGVARGVLLALLTPSPDRIESPCALSERCGGCPLISLQLPAQHALKLERVRRAVAGLCAPAVDPDMASPGAAFAYRRRARFRYQRVGNGVVLGYFAHGSHRLIDVDACPVLEPSLDRALRELREVLAPTLTGSGEIEVAALAGDRVVAHVRCESAAPSAAYRAAEALAARASFAGVSLSVAEGAAARFGEATHSAAVGLDGAPVHAPSEGFSQVHAAANERLGSLVLELAESAGARVVELYAGHGNFTVLLAQHAQSLVAVEGNPASAAACRDNLRARDYSAARVIAADVAAARLPERCDVIVLDPPRAGAPQLASIVAKTQPERVVYVSCHMTTLSRDLRALYAAGYVADRVHAIDMFPQTAHVEAVVRMRRGAS